MINKMSLTLETKLYRIILKNLHARVTGEMTVKSKILENYEKVLQY
jgi:hypothetical protein